MNTDSVGTPYDASPESAIAAILAYEGPILVDLDETLYLRNSTEDFLDCARPGLLALLLLRALDLLRPWRLFGGEPTRDVWRVRLISIALPWTRRRWRRRVGQLALRFSNRRLIAALRARAQPPIIVTAGFEPVVAPLVAAMGFEDSRIVAARLGSLEDRRLGKLHTATRDLGTEIVSSALIVTDSIQDLELLQQCARPLRTVWPEARFRRALSKIYLPGEYLSHVKRPGARYIMRGILQEDFAFWVLSSVGLAMHPFTHIVGLLLLITSFWAVYERGYVDNDLIAAHYERDPKLTPEYWNAPVATPMLLPWVWAAGAGALALLLLQPAIGGFAFNFGKWAAALVATYLCFKLYNRLDKTTRVWLYPALQFARSAAFTVIVPISPIAAAALGAHVVSRWVPYHLYRLGATRWPSAQPALIRLLAFLVLALLIGRSLGAAAYLNWTALALLLWILFGARREILAVVKAARRLDTHSVDVAHKPVEISALPQQQPLTETPMFSVVIPTCNRVATIGRALRSVLTQTMDDYEVIIVDDGSTDGTHELLGALDCTRCRVLSNPVNSGVSAARNRGVAAAKGEFIAFLDDDDEFRPTVLAALRERCLADPKPDFLWGVRVIHERAPNGHTISTRVDDWRDISPSVSDSEFLPLTLRLATSAVFTIRRTLFEQLGGFDEALKVSEDRDLFITLAEGGYLGAPVNAALIDVDEGVNSLSRSSSGVRGGADVDLRVIDKHLGYLRRPDHHEFLSEYLLVVFAGFLQAGNRRSAMHIVNELRQRGALDSRVFRNYLRHAPEFRALKRAIRYSTMRRIRNRLLSRVTVANEAA
jgi:glycosyltransferase involved in cell wall biosynthesis